MGTLCCRLSNIESAKMKTFFALVALVLSVNAKKEFEACPGFNNDKVVNPLHLTVNPDPVVIKKGQEVHVHFDANLVSTIVAGTKVDVKMTKFGVPLPCLTIPNFPIKVGSCTFDAEDVLDLVPKDFCDKFVPPGQQCTLPLGPGFYGDKDANGYAAIVVPDIPSLVIPLIQGDIKVEVRSLTPLAPRLSVCKTHSPLRPEQQRVHCPHPPPTNSSLKIQILCISDLY